jgi:hypothetical protein
VFSKPAFKLLSFPLSVTHGEKPEGSMAARVVGAAMEHSGFSAGVIERELQELDSRFSKHKFLSL